MGVVAFCPDGEEKTHSILAISPWLVQASQLTAIILQIESSFVENGSFPNEVLKSHSFSAVLAQQKRSAMGEGIMGEVFRSPLLSLSRTVPYQMAQEPNNAPLWRLWDADLHFELERRSRRLRPPLARAVFSESPLLST
jgi:hypothetical protein